MTVIQLPKKSTKRPVHEAVDEANKHAISLRERRFYRAAIMVAKRAIAVTPNSKELWSNIGTFYWYLRELDDAIACVDRALSIDPNYGLAFFNKALILESLGRFDEAEECFTKSLTIDNEHLNVKWCRSMLRLARGDYERGFEDYEARIPFRQKEGAKVYPKFPAPYWQGEDIKGKKIFCCIEQGIGDTIMFSRWLPWLKKKVGPKGTVYLCCAQELTALLWEFRHIVTFIPESVPIPEADYSVVTGSLPWHSRTTLKKLPADPGRIRKRADIQMKIGKAAVPEPMGPDAYKVGVIWSGNPENDRNEERSIPFELILDLAAHPNVWLYSLQAGAGRRDIERFGASGLVCDLGVNLEKQGLPTAATAILQMDLLITCCTSMAHLAGALGVEAWVVLCKTPYWVWMHEREDSPWYPSLRLFRQDQTNNWTSVMGRVRDELFDRLDRRRARLIIG